MHATVGATVWEVLCQCWLAYWECFSRADSTQLTTVTGWSWDPRSSLAVPEFTGSCPHIACVSPGAFRNTSAQPRPIRFPNRVGRMHRRHAVPRKKGWAFGEGDRETLPLTPMCSAVPVRDVIYVKPTSAVPKPVRGCPGGMPAAPGACKGRMMHRGLTLRENGATATSPPQSAAFLAQISAISIISPLHQRRPHPSPSRGLDKAQTRARSLCRARLFPTCLAASVRAGIWNMAQSSLITTRSGTLGLVVPATWRHSYSKVLIIRLGE